LSSNSGNATSVMSRNAIAPCRTDDNE
jgi:hypothetical protein